MARTFNPNNWILGNPCKKHFGSRIRIDNRFKTCVLCLQESNHRSRTKKNPRVAPLAPSEERYEELYDFWWYHIPTNTEE